MNKICTYLLTYYTVKLNRSLVSERNNAKGYHYYANMQHNFVSLLARQKISSNLGVKTGLIPCNMKAPLAICSFWSYKTLEL